MENILLHLCAVIKNSYVSSTLLTIIKVTHKVIHKICVKQCVFFYLNIIHHFLYSEKGNSADE